MYTDSINPGSLLEQRGFAIEKLQSMSSDSYNASPDQALNLAHSACEITDRVFPGQKTAALGKIDQIYRPTLQIVLGSPADPTKKDQLINDFHSCVSYITSSNEIPLKPGKPEFPIILNINPGQIDPELEKAINFLTSTSENGISTGGEKPTQDKILRVCMTAITLKLKKYMLSNRAKTPLTVETLRDELSRLYRIALQASNMTNDRPERLEDFQVFYNRGINTK